MILHGIPNLKQPSIISFVQFFRVLFRI